MTTVMVKVDDPEWGINELWSASRRWYSEEGDIVGYLFMGGYVLGSFIFSFGVTLAIVT